MLIYPLNYSMASTAPILINLILTQRDYVKIFCTSSHKSIKKYGMCSYKYIEFFQ